LNRLVADEAIVNEFSERIRSIGQVFLRDVVQDDGASRAFVRQYDEFGEWLGTGVDRQMRVNEVVSDLFEFRRERPEYVSFDAATSGAASMLAWTPGFMRKRLVRDYVNRKLSAEYDAAST
jgi:hypothetical protein